MVSMRGWSAVPTGRGLAGSSRKGNLRDDHDVFGSGQEEVSKAENVMRKTGKPYAVWLNRDERRLRRGHVRISFMIFCRCTIWKLCNV